MSARACVWTHNGGVYVEGPDGERQCLGRPVDVRRGPKGGWLCMADGIEVRLTDEQERALAWAVMDDEHDTWVDHVRNREITP